MLKRFAVAGALLVSACATDGVKPTEPKIVIQTVKVPTPVPCKPDLGPEPSYPDTDAALKAAPDVFAWGKLMIAGRLMRIQRDAEKSAALAACANIPTGGKP